MINIYGFNIINLILIDRVKGAHVLMNCVLKYCQIEKKENEDKNN